MKLFKWHSIDFWLPVVTLLALPTSLVYLTSGFGAYFWNCAASFAVLTGLVLFVIFGLRPARRESEFIAANYFSQLVPAIGVSLVALALLAVALAYYREETVAVVCAGILGVLLVHVFVTRYRVERGLFGSTADEASELIGFIIERTKYEGKPPGSSISKAFRPEKSKVAVTLPGTSAGVVR